MTFRRCGPGSNASIDTWCQVGGRTAGFFYISAQLPSEIHFLGYSNCCGIWWSSSENSKLISAEGKTEVKHQVTALSPEGVTVLRILRQVCQSRQNTLLLDLA